MKDQRITWYSFSTVSESEMKLLLAKQPFRNFFKLFNNLSALPGFPLHWLITSIDRSSKDGELRFAKEQGNHKDSNAVDIVPISFDERGKFILSLPIPLNRNFLLHKLFRAYFDNYDSLPIIAFESDHIHLDVMHHYDIVYLNKAKSILDEAVYELVNIPSTDPALMAFKKAINDGSLVSIPK